MTSMTTRRVGLLQIAWGLALLPLLLAVAADGALVKVGVAPVGVAGSAVPFDRALPYLFTDQRLVLPVETPAAAVRRSESGSGTAAGAVVERGGSPRDDHQSATQAGGAQHDRAGGGAG